MVMQLFLCDKLMLNSVVGHDESYASNLPGYLNFVDDNSHSDRVINPLLLTVVIV